MSEQNIPKKENRMGTDPIPKLLFSMAIPMMLSMMVQALYNVVDSIFVAKLSEDALTAVSLAFPVQMVMSAIAVGTGVAVAVGIGVSSDCGISVGAGVATGVWFSMLTGMRSLF